MRTAPSTPASAEVSPPASDASSTVERRYAIHDRAAHALFVAVCRSMNLTAYARSAGALPPIYVTAPEAATHDRLWARFQALVPDLDEQVAATTAAFIRVHCGIEMALAPHR